MTVQESSASPIVHIAKASDVIRRRNVPCSRIPDADAKLRAAYHYWQSKRNNGLLPARRDIDVLDLRNLMGRMHVIDVADRDPPDYRYRLFASNIPLDQFKNYTNMRLGDYPSEAYRRTVMEDYLACVTTGVPLYQQIVASIDYMNYSYSRLLLPVADDGRKVNMLFACTNDRKFDDLTL